MTGGYHSPVDPNAAVYTSVYGLHREISYAYPAGMECEPLGRKFHVAEDTSSLKPPGMQFNTCTPPTHSS